MARRCANWVIREDPAGLLIDASTKEPFTYKDPCVELNPHVGFDPAATEAAKMSVNNSSRQYLSYRCTAECARFPFGTAPLTNYLSNRVAVESKS